jgi:CMP-N,N'-diacetyllegionaminic acid synthase
MHGEARVLTLIPARAGSKGLPRKNVLEVAGLPLIAWSILAAKNSRFVDRIVVSTDGSEIADVARTFGGEVPFMRPAELASDEASTQDVVLHCLDELEKEGSRYDLVVILQPTSPLRTAEDIDSALELLASKGAEAVVSVCRAQHSLLLANTLPPDGDMRDFLRPEVTRAPRQALPHYYRLNGALYAAKWERLRSGGWFYGPGSYAYVMPPERSVDIDEEFDLQVADCLLSKRLATGDGLESYGRAARKRRTSPSSL